MFRRIVVLREGSTRARQGLFLAKRIASFSGGTFLFPSTGSIPHTFGEPQLRQIVEQKEAGEECALSEAQSVSETETSRTPAPGSEAPGFFGGMPASESDLLLITGPGYEGLKPWRLEHVAKQAASYPPGPVLLLRAGATAHSRARGTKTRPSRPLTTVVALDGSQEAERALMPAAHLTAALAAPTKGSLHLTRVILCPDIEALLHGQERIDPNARDQIMEEAIDYLCQITNSLQASLEKDLGLAITWSITLDSDVVSALIGTAEQGNAVGGTCLFNSCDLLALASHHHDMKGYWMPGNVTGRLFTSTNLPLFLV